ncbi:MAG: hypothetical protein ACLFRG_17020 [Desulfococcaceae bacterium]
METNDKKDTTNSDATFSEETPMESSKKDWRKKMIIRPRILVSTEEFIQPIDDIWDGYI